jgi:predicted permease
MRDLDEEQRRLIASGVSRRKVSVWRFREALGIGLYALRDARRSRRVRSGVHPRLALLLAVRSIRRAPGLPLAAAMTLGLGFGAAASIYGVYSGFDRPLPVPGGAAVYRVRVLDERGRAVAVTARDAEVLGAATSSFEALGAFATETWTVRVGEKGAVRVTGASMTPAAFELLRVGPRLGRAPGAGDEQALVVSHDFWRHHLEADQEAIGQALRVDGVERLVVGVMPANHRFPFNQGAWTLLDESAEEPVELVARLSPGVTPAQAATDVERVLEGPRFAAGLEVPDLRVDVLGFTQERGESGESAALATLLALVVALVLVSCSNVSNLLLARALARAELLTVHAALGAGPVQLVVQMFVEALLISLAGALAGLGIAAIAIGYIETTLSGHWGYYWMQVRFELGVVAFTLALAVLTGLVAGLTPAIRLGRADLAVSLKSGASGVVGGSRRRLSSLLLNGQVAFSCFALVIAMLLAAALLRSRVAEGYPAEEIYFAGVTLEGQAYQDKADRRAFREALRGALTAEERVGVVALSNVVPSLPTVSAELEIEGVSREPGARPRFVPTLAVTSSYFEMFGIGLISGRLFSDVEDGSGDTVAVVSDSFVREHFSAPGVVGQRIRLERATGDAWLRIIGVVADRPVYEGARTREMVRAYVPFGLVEPADHYVLYRAAGAETTPAVRRAIAALDPDVAVAGVFGLEGETRIADVIAYVRRIFETVGTLGLLGGVSAAVVALLGLYGALAFEVQRRIGEIGVRMALGASSRDVMLHVASAGLVRVAPGLILGFVMSAGVSPLLGALLGETNPRDPLIHVGVYLAFLAVSVLAVAVPGRRAARLDPVSVLRGE